jgi:RNA polymerase sigma factor (sigma-70 family)
VEAITHDHEDARLQFVERFKGDAHTQFKARSFGLSGVRQQERKAAAEAFLEQLVAVSSPLHVFTGGMALRTYVRIQLIEAARNSGSSPFPNEECRRVHQHAMERTDRLGREKYGEPDDRISTRVPEASLVARHAAVLAAAVADLKGPLLQAVRDESLDELERAFVTQMRRKQELSEDCVLVDAVVAGRRTAIETFYCNFFGDVQREAKRYMADEPSREQQVQDLMTELLYPGEKNPLPLVDRYRGDGRLQAFLKKVARDKLRPAKRGSDQDPTLLAETLATEPSQSWSIPADLLNAIREQLNSQEQLCLTSIYWDGLSQAEFARRSGVERWDVSRQHAAILKKVQRLLKQHGVESMDDLCSEEVTADGNEVR